MKNDSKAPYNFYFQFAIKKGRWSLEFNLSWPHKIQKYKAHSTNYFVVTNAPSTSPVDLAMHKLNDEKNGRERHKVIVLISDELLFIFRHTMCNTKWICQDCSRWELFLFNFNSCRDFWHWGSCRKEYTKIIHQRSKRGRDEWHIIVRSH